MSFCRVVRAFLHCGQRCLLSTQTLRQDKDINWTDHQHSCGFFLTMTSVQTLLSHTDILCTNCCTELVEKQNKKLLTFPLNLCLHCIIIHLISIISITIDVPHLFWHCFLEFMVEQAFVHSALSHLGLQKKNIHKMLSIDRSTKRYSTRSHIWYVHASTHQPTSPTQSSYVV